MTNGTPKSTTWWVEHLAIPLAFAIVTAGSAPWWWPRLTEHLPSSLGGTRDITSLERGCPSGWQVYAQNRWTPVGAAVRAKPTTEAKRIDSVAPNIPVTVDGWIHASIPFPNNPEPFNSDVWLHRIDESGGGWISFAGVRAVPTDPDPTLHNPDGGIPAPLPKDCAGK